MNDSSPLDNLELIISRWWLLTLLAVAGGLVGWVIGQVNSPVYEARASMVIFLNVSQEYKLSDSQSSSELSNIAALVSPRALAPGLIPEFEKCYENIAISNMQIERRETRWDLVVRCSDPQAAAELANIWVERANSMLEQCYSHGLKVQSLAATSDLLISCNDDPLQEICSGISDLDILDQRIQSLWDEIEVEKKASQGINPNLVFRVESQAAVPTKPVAHDPGVLILAGAVIGLLIGIITTTAHSRNYFRKRS